MVDDATLLRRYALEHSQQAFTALVERHLDLVYAAALRRTGGDAHRAADIAQIVFAKLAQDAKRLASHPVLAGWLYTATRNATLNTLRTETRRRAREHEAYAMQETFSEPEIEWEQLRPVLDAAMDELDQRDREAVLIRFFQGRSFAEVAAVLKVSEEAARKRVERAVDKLRGPLARRGITSTAAALGGALAAQPAIAVPAGLTTTVAGVGLSGGALAGSSSSTMGWFFSGQKIAAVGLVSTAALLFYLSADARLTARTASETERQNQVLANLRAANTALREQNQRTALQQAEQAKGRTAAADPLDPLRALAALMKEEPLGRGRGLQWMNAGRAYEVFTPVIKDLLALNPAEASAFADLLNRTKNEISALAISQLGVQRNEREILLTIPAIPAAQESHARLRTAMKDLLGAERFRLVEEIGYPQTVERWLEQFGLAPSTLVVWRVTNPRQAIYPYALEQRQPNWRPPPPSIAAGSIDTHPGAMDLASLKINLGPFAKFVPEDF